jgi:hypothetical protein
MVLFLSSIGLTAYYDHTEPCYGPGCEIVTCPDNYLMEVEPNNYVRCEDIDLYSETKDENLLFEVRR